MSETSLRSNLLIGDEMKRSVSLQSLETIDLNNFMVKLTNVSFSYGKNKPNILSDINMQFPKSAIYGLLGPSGCGKTTLLRLILGFLYPKSGSIEVNGRKPLHPLNGIPGPGVGFQPQEVGLYQEFTIQETLSYFAELYGLTKENKIKRIKFLLTFLSLPEPERSVKSLSGGQQRRLSLAVAIVHNPPFLILDEPTVGVDPLLRERIWDHLVILSNEEKTSILITTHYIEEARRAHVIALMRSGKLLVEQTPKNLLDHFQVQNLETVFLKVCQKQEDSKDQQPMPKSFIETIDQRKAVSQKSKARKTKGFGIKSSHLKRFKALVNKNFIRITRNLLMLTFQILTPTITMVIFCICIGRLPENLKVAVFNDEILSNDTKPYHECGYNNYSLLYLKQIDAKSVRLVDFDTNESAIGSVQKSDTFGALVFHRNFSGSLCNRFNDKSVQTRTEGTIKYFGDLTDVTIYQTISRALYKAELAFLREMVTVVEIYTYNKTGNPIDPESLTPVLEIVDPPVHGSFEVSFRDFMIPGMMISSIFILAVGLTAISFVAEKKEGLLERTLLTGVRIYEILFAQIFIQIFVLFIQILTLMLIIFPIFDLTNKGSYALIIFINLLQGVCGMTYGLVISVVTPDEQSAIMIAFGTFFPVLLLSGVFWPIEGMIFGLQYVSYYFPHTLAVLSLRNIMQKGWDLTHAFVWLGYVASFAWIIIFIAFAIIFSAF